MALVARAPDGFMTIGCATARRRTLQVRGRAIAGTHKLTPRFIEKWSACSTRTACRWEDRKSTRLNSSHGYISYAVFCLKKKNKHLHLVGDVQRLRAVPAAVACREAVS